MVERGRVSVLTRSDVGGRTAIRPPTDQEDLVSFRSASSDSGTLETGAAWSDSKDGSGVGAPTRAAAGAPPPSSRLSPPSSSHFAASASARDLKAARALAVPKKRCLEDLPQRSEQL
jgi:hypothetical protein